MDRKGTELESVDWIHVTEDRDKGRAVVDTRNVLTG
jgi:hypothetical protein